ncbi:SKI/DACH domain-containing protein 1 [Ctenopharyngodon idella]|uniref:SKI/DACH domain-containing protein 1 n=1 Tax=Ctenopharyngodon idella TaxID=7959 RepID=UPI00223132A5|nr:SKI/DACH domain-containing protein 1 [Ctenopharyngodon idella]
MKKMGDLESGFEEMQGVKLGYLVIKGKQMFALSQVFTDLLKNIPRTTVHKRMDHLNVKKHHCDLEELRKLKAINSIAFHAAKCTLISREDVEALYFSCKTERVLKSNKRREKTKNASEKMCDGKNHTSARSDFWREKVWLSLHGVPQTFSFKNKAVRQDPVPRTHSNLPQIYSKSFARDFQPVTKSASTPFKNYETDQIPDNCVAFNQKHAFFRHVVNRQPLIYQSAIAAQAKHQGNADLLYKRKRKRESCVRQFWSRSKRSHPVLLVPKCCKPKVPNGSLSQFHHLEHGLYVDPRHTGHFQESCSSDTESSSISERVNNDSDFGSSFSTTSNSGTSDEEEEEDDSLSDSSDVSSDEESSSQSDSSSVSSQVSVQSIRFRRARFSSLNTKAPLLLQPTFHYRPNVQNIPTNQGVTTTLDCERTGKTQKSDFSSSSEAHRDGDAANVQKFCPVRTCFPDLRENEGSEAQSRLEFSNDPKTTDSVANKIKDIGLSPHANGNKAFPQQRIPGSANKCSQALISHCVQDKEITVCKSSDSNLSLAANSKRETKTSLKLPSPLKPIKTEAEELITTSGFNNEGNRAVKTPPFLLNNVKIKVEDTFDEYEYANQPQEYQCKDNDADGQRISNHFKETDHCKATESSVQKHPPCNEESRSTLNTPCSEEGECKNGARVRKNYRAMLLGKKVESVRTPAKSVAKVDRSPRSAGKFASNEGSNEDCAGASKRKRTNANVASLKKPFRFMANFPSPPSLVIGSDGDLSPAYSLNSLRSNQLPHSSHPVWRWQLGHSVVPPPPSHKFRKASVIP